MSEHKEPLLNPDNVNVQTNDLLSLGNPPISDKELGNTILNDIKEKIELDGPNTNVGAIKDYYTRLYGKNNVNKFTPIFNQAYSLVNELSTQQSIQKINNAPFSIEAPKFSQGQYLYADDLKKAYGDELVNIEDIYTSNTYTKIAENESLLGNIGSSLLKFPLTITSGLGHLVTTVPLGMAQLGLSIPEMIGFDVPDEWQKSISASILTLDDAFTAWEHLGPFSYWYNFKTEYDGSPSFGDSVHNMITMLPDEFFRVVGFGGGLRAVTQGSLKLSKFASNIFGNKIGGNILKSTVDTFTGKKIADVVGNTLHKAIKFKYPNTSITASKLSNATLFSLYEVASESGVAQSRFFEKYRGSEHYTNEKDVLNDSLFLQRTMAALYVIPAVFANLHEVAGALPETFDLFLRRKGINVTEGLNYVDDYAKEIIKEKSFGLKKLGLNTAGEVFEELHMQFVTDVGTVYTAPYKTQTLLGLMNENLDQYIDAAGISAFTSGPQTAIRDYIDSSPTIYKYVDNSSFLKWLKKSGLYSPIFDLTGDLENMKNDVNQSLLKALGMQNFSFNRPLDNPFENKKEEDEKEEDENEDDLDDDDENEDDLDDDDENDDDLDDDDDGDDDNNNDDDDDDNNNDDDDDDNNNDDDGDDDNNNDDDDDGGGGGNGFDLTNEIKDYNDIYNLYKQLEQNPDENLGKDLINKINKKINDITNILLDNKVDGNIIKKLSNARANYKYIKENVIRILNNLNNKKSSPKGPIPSKINISIKNKTHKALMNILAFYEKDDNNKSSYEKLKEFLDILQSNDANAINNAAQLIQQEIILNQGDEALELYTNLLKKLYSVYNDYITNGTLSEQSNNILSSIDKSRSSILLLNRDIKHNQNGNILSLLANGINVLDDFIDKILVKTLDINNLNSEVDDTISSYHNSLSELVELYKNNKDIQSMFSDLLQVHNVDINNLNSFNHESLKQQTLDNYSKHINTYKDFLNKVITFTDEEEFANFAENLMKKLDNNDNAILKHILNMMHNKYKDDSTHLSRLLALSYSRLLKNKLYYDDLHNVGKLNYENAVNNFLNDNNVKDFKNKLQDLKSNINSKSDKKDKDNELIGLLDNMINILNDNKNFEYNGFVGNINKLISSYSDYIDKDTDKSLNNISGLIQNIGNISESLNISSNEKFVYDKQLENILNNPNEFTNAKKEILIDVLSDILSLDSIKNKSLTSEEKENEIRKTFIKFERKNRKLKVRAC